MYVRVREAEKMLSDVTEMIDYQVIEEKLLVQESLVRRQGAFLDSLRLGILYHESALILMKRKQKSSHAQMSFDLLSRLMASVQPESEFLPLIAAYRASARSLQSAGSGKLSELAEAFEFFEEAAQKYALFSPYPEFLRGSVAENLPSIFFKKRRFAQIDFYSLQKKYETDNSFADSRLMSFVYLALARIKRKNDVSEANLLLKKAMSLDSEQNAAYNEAEKLLANAEKK
jgi:hypothetical protein